MSPRFQASMLRHSAFALFVPALIAGPGLLAQKDATATSPVAAASASAPDRGSAYYHYGLARMYEEMATSGGRQDYATQAIERNP